MALDGLVLEGLDTFFCSGFAGEMVFFVGVVWGEEGFGTYGVGTITRGVAIVAAGGGVVE